MKIRDLIKYTRNQYKESQVEFAKRFKTTANTISRWETGQYDVPNWVIELLVNSKEKEVMCPKCYGRGKIFVHNFDSCEDQI